MKEILTTKKFYNTHGQHWLDTKTNSFVHEKPFTKLVSLWPEKAQIIDIGCAGGIHAPLFLGIGSRLKYYGIDISTLFLKTATRRYPNLQFQYGDIADASTLPNKKFAGFFAASTLMHVPFPLWDTMFSNIEHMVTKRGFGYLTLPVAHPSKVKDPNDVRHFTILTETEHIEYLKNRNWKIIKKGSMDGTTSTDVWRYYIVQLP